MNDPRQSDYLSDYDLAITKLTSEPNNAEHKHQAVLALARAGSLDFALAEYKRYRLGEVRNHEDIMALGGRLSKDLFRSTSGATSLEHARDSAEKYEAAFQDTKGFYSGINSATMAFVTDMPWEIVKQRVKSIMALLPATDELSPEDHYFVEATRAECFLLLGKTSDAKEALRNAVTFDPQNFTAHASTLKQFDLILDKRQANKSWLEGFKPPRPAHFAGHLWANSDLPSKELELQLSDLIQLHDIGFGYGTLAAGADILISEALLAEGAELNILLPRDIDGFIEHSIRPYGQDWLPRFESCLNQAHSIICLPATNDDFDAMQNNLCGQIAMGQSIIRSQILEVEPIQILIKDPARSNSFTARHKKDWTDAGLQVEDIPISQASKKNRSGAKAQENFPVLLARVDAPITTYENFHTAFAAIAETPAPMHALHFGMPNAENEIDAIMRHKHIGGILVSEALASFVALKHRNDFKITFAGAVETPNGQPTRCYTLKPVS